MTGAVGQRGAEVIEGSRLFLPRPVTIVFWHFESPMRWRCIHVHVLPNVFAPPPDLHSGAGFPFSMLAG
jgi:hypothetical protein